jgi:DNA segregation ATPase FtsK/SpoIIIE-like protein
MGNLTGCRDVVIWAIDLKGGIELPPWASCIGRLATTPAEASALLRDAVAILHARTAHLASLGLRAWEPSPQMPALVIIIHEYAELAEEAPKAMGDTDSIARLGRAVAVTLIAATQRPTQKVMGQGAVRSQMDLRICFRVNERRDVDLILGQGMLAAGWHAHKLNAPGKFLVSAPEHSTPRRARAYLVTDQDVAEAAARHAQNRPELDDVSRGAILPASDRAAAPGLERADYGSEPADDATADAEETLWLALCMAPDDDVGIAELMRVTGTIRPTLYRHLTQLNHADRAVQVGWGRWRAVTTEGPTYGE